MSKLEELYAELKKATKTLEEVISGLTTDFSKMEQMKKESKALEEIGTLATFIAYWTERFSDLQGDTADNLEEINEKYAESKGELK